jgi:HAE1 family hydrophobic/amphiphilic exporter-1
MSIAAFSIKRPVLISMVMVGLVIFGVLAYVGMPLNITPAIEIPYVLVQTTYAGASPDLIESQISKKIEDAVSMISGLDTIVSYSLENASLVLLKFNMDKDVDDAVQEVTQKVNNISNDLPDDADSPTYKKININEMPILKVMLAGDSSKISMAELYDLADKKVKNTFSQVIGVGETSVTGGQEREIHVEFDSRVVFQNEISLAQVNSILAASNLNLPAGYYQKEGQEFSVKFDGELKIVNAIGELEIPTGKGKQKIKDLATISDTTERARERTIYFDYQNNIRNDLSVLIEISKTSDGNAVAIEKQIKELMDEMRPELPDGVDMYVVSETASVTSNTVNDTMSNIMMGIGFTAIILLFFLHSFRSTIIVAITMPLSILPTFIALSAMGFSLNIMSLMGISTAVGVLVMNSVVILENIFAHKQRGEGGRSAARTGTDEVAVAVVASTLTNVAVFMPLGTMSGIAGQMLKEFALAVVFATLFSIFIAFTLTPMMAAYLLPEHDTRKHPIGDKFELIFKMWEKGYRKVVEFIIKTKLRSLIVVVIIVGLFLFSMSLFKYIPFEFMPNMDQGQVDIEMELAKGFDLSETYNFTQEVEKRMAKYTDMVEHGSTTVGKLSDMDTGVNMAKITLSLTPKATRKYNSNQLSNMIIKDLSDIPGVIIRAFSSSKMGMNQHSIDFYLKGPDMEVLKDFQEQIYPKLEQIPGLVNLDVSSRGGVPQLTIIPHLKEIADAGTSVQAIAVTLRTSLEGMSSTTFKDKGEEYDIKVLLVDNSIKSFEDVGNIPIATSAGVFPLSHFADIQYTTGFSKILRSDRETVIEFTGDVAEGYAQSNITRAIAEITSELDFPFGYRYETAGNSKEMAKTVKQMAFVFIIAIVLTYMLLAAILENLWQPVLILFTVPLAMIGVVGVYLMTGKAMNFIGMMSIVMLVGMVVNNAILILDYANQLRREGKSMQEALIIACPEKLKAIIMSNVATILGLLPMALGLGAQGAEMRQPMGLVSVGGLVTSTILTLFMTPASQFLFAGRKKKKQTAEVAAEGADK